MKFYVLVSSSIQGLYRNCVSLPRKDTVVVINTIDDNYRNLAETYCKKFNIEYYITESDGTAATGKNSVIDLFLASDNEYMVQVDGDDLITPHGIKVYTELSKVESPPDMVILYRQPQISLNLNNFEWLYNEWDGKLQSLSDAWELKYPFDKSDPTYLQHTKSVLYHYFITKCTPDEDLARQWAIDRFEFNERMNTYGEVREYMCRMVFYSRKAAEHVRFNNNLMVGEDTIQFLKMKKLALEGKLTILRRKEREIPTYLYTNDPTQLTQRFYKSGKDWSWIRPFLIEFDKIKDELIKHKSLPEFKDPV